MSPWWNVLPEMAAASVFVPRMSSSCLLLLWETRHDQQVGLSQAPFKILLLPWVLEHEFLGASFKSGVSISPCPLGLPKVSSTGLQSQMLWGLASWHKTLGFGDPDVGLRPIVPWEEPLQLIILPFVGRPPSGVGLDCIVFLHHHPPPAPSGCGFLGIFSCRGSFLFASVFLIHSCSINSCSFGVPVR